MKRIVEGGIGKRLFLDLCLEEVQLQGTKYNVELTN